MKKKNGKDDDNNDVLDAINSDFAGEVCVMAGHVEVVVCSICGSKLTEFHRNYPNPICRECDSRAVNSKGEMPEWHSMGDCGDNPVFIDGIKCWRRYRFGGYITMRDFLDCQDDREFFERCVEPHFHRPGGDS